jgi:transcriptional regulator with XRE-family HTH domain
MGKASRQIPSRLGEKLAQIRHAFGLSQNGIIRRLELTGISRGNLSQYELGRRDPPYSLLLTYARAAGVWLDVLIDDELDLPTKIPSTSKHKGITRRSSPRRNRG